MKLSDAIKIERQPNGDYQISWTDAFTQNPVKIYVSDAPDISEESELIHSGEGPSVAVEHLREPRRYYFHLVPEDGDGVTVGERVMPLREGMNFRDFGGYPTADGKRVKWGRLYRSGHLAELDERSQAYLNSLGIRTNCDFRRSMECETNPNQLPQGTQVVSLDVDAGNFSTFFTSVTEEQLTREYMVEVMRQVNRQLVSDYQPRYKRMFAELLALEEGAFLINCTAGKDRTGFGAALILSALGVPRETVVEDYLLSAEHFKPKMDPRSAEKMAEKYGPAAVRVMQSDAVRPLAEVRPEYLLAALDFIDEQYGSLEAFLQEAYGVGDRERQLLRERFTS